MAKTLASAKIDASGIYYRDLNTRIRHLATEGVRKVRLENVYGQRYIGTSLDKPIEIEVHGTPGNDLGAFMNGSRIVVYGNTQDGCGNTMNDGEIIVHGRAGDIAGLSARGGKIFIRDDVGYRAGIHMKEYGEKKPVVIIGGTAQDFLAEYMAGGILILLGLNLNGEKHNARFIGTGMHGGVVYIRGSIEAHQLGKEVGVADLDEEERHILKQYVDEFAEHFDYQPEEILNQEFLKLYPRWLRPYGKLYTY